MAEAKIANARQSQIAPLRCTRKLAETEALGAVSKERDGLANALDHARDAQQAATQLAEAKHVPTAGDPSWFANVCRVANVMRLYL